jgi:hypothetical protein
MAEMVSNCLIASTLRWAIEVFRMVCKTFSYLRRMGRRPAAAAAAAKSARHSAVRKVSACTVSLTSVLMCSKKAKHWTAITRA